MEKSLQKPDVYNLQKDRGNSGKFLKMTPELLALLQPHFRTCEFFQSGEFSRAFFGK